MSGPPWPYARPRNQPLSLPQYAVAGQPCFFTVRCAPGKAPFAQPRLADIGVSCLLDQRMKIDCDVVVYCLLPDHLHVVLTPRQPGASSLLFLQRFKGWSSYEVRRAGWPHAVWQPRSYDHLICGDEDLQAIVEYILANPVRAGLCDDPVEYPWSGMPDAIAA